MSAATASNLLPHTTTASFSLPCRKTRVVANANLATATTVKRKPSVMDCKRFVGAPMTREQAQMKLDSCPRFRQLTQDSPKGFAGLARRFTTKTSKTAKLQPTFTGQLVNRAIALDYGNRLRACLLESKNRKVRHSTPY